MEPAGYAGQSGSGPKTNPWLKRLKRMEPLFWIGPAMIVLVLLVAYPTVYALRMSFFQWNLTRPAAGMSFVGFGNYARLLQDEYFLEALSNTGLLVLGSVAVQFVIGVGLALALNRVLPGIRLARALLIAPTMMAPVIVGLIWRYMYFSGYGIIPHVLGWFGITVQDGILATHGVALMAIMLTDIWQWTPFVVLVVLAGLQSLSHEPIEAAQIDGASRWQILRYVTLPLLKPVLLVTLLIRLMDAVKAFDTIYAMTKGGPGNSTMTVTYYGYTQGLNFFEMGYGAAISFVILWIVLIMSQIFIRVVYRHDKI